MKISLKSAMHRLRSTVLLRLSDDLRKAAYLMGIGIIGVVVPSDNISFFEGIILFLFGWVMWIIGHIFAYYSDTKPKNTKGVKK